VTVNDVSQLFRPGLLDGATVAVSDPVRPALVTALTSLGAEIAAGEVDALVVDAAAYAGDLVEVSGRIWDTVRDVANAAWIEPGRPGRYVLVAPAEGEPLRAALENLARTTSIEWARYGIRSTAVRPGPGTSEAEVAAVVAYLLSAAGDYFSGTALDLA
jgi:hypothetical protein